MRTFGLFLLCWGWTSLAWAGLRFEPANPDTNADIYAITTGNGGFTHVAVTWSGPRSGSAGCAPGRPCGQRNGNTWTWHHHIGRLPVGTYQVTFKSDQCNPCDTATLVVSPPCTPKPETCDNKDNDCDGQLDEGLERACYSGPKGTQGKGPCKAGKQICIAGTWARCVGEQTPVSEICDDKIDNNCNGQIDDGCECKDGQTRACYTGPKETQGKGICKAGTQTCKNSTWLRCEGDTKPQPKEICDDGLDNNCNGQIDEGCGNCSEGDTRICYSGPEKTANVGACKAGTQTCKGGKWSACVGEHLPATHEVCGDQVDDDCDGIVDNGCQTGPEGAPGEAAQESVPQEPLLPPNDAGPIDIFLCPNGRVVWNCTTTGRCTQVCRPLPKKGCSCQSSNFLLPWSGLFIGLFVLLCLRRWRRGKDLS